MTESNPEPELDPQLDEPAPDPEPAEPADDGLVPAPEDVPEGIATGYSVYNRTLGQYVPGVHGKKPTKADAGKRVPEGHTAAVVRV